MRPAPRLLLALACATLPLAPAPAGAQAPPLWGGVAPGPHAVGFRVEQRFDPARSREGSERGRPVRVALWYPARPAGARLTLRGYARLLAGPGEERRALSFPTDEAGPPAARVDSLLALRTYAAAGAPAATGRHPLVVLGMGWSYESPLMQVVLAEYLVSRGYVVAAPVLAGTRSPEVRVDAADLETAVRDLEQAAVWARTLPGVDPERLAVAGFDLGGMAAALLAMRDARVDAVVSLDSGILSDRLMRELMRPSPFYALDRLRAPLLHATRPREENLARGLGEDLAVFDSAGAAPRYLLRVPGMRHADFALWGMVEGVLPAFWGSVEGNPAPKHAALLLRVGRFLDAWVRGDAGARAALDRDPR
ncbi:MAG TPA: dienelactone hydrolase family protein [Longimicrobiaceae bacterium]